MERHNGIEPDPEGAFVYYADAQATVEALQARVRELEEWKRIVTGAGTDQESVIRLAAHEYTKTAIQCWKEANAKLESQLTQRTAELEAANTLLYKKNCALGRAETSISDLQAELERVRGLVKALPQVEGDFDVVARYRNENGSVHLNDEVKAILKHRQGMEG